MVNICNTGIRIMFQANRDKVYTKQHSASLKLKSCADFVSVGTFL